MDPAAEDLQFGGPQPGRPVRASDPARRPDPSADVGDGHILGDEHLDRAAAVLDDDASTGRVEQRGRRGDDRLDRHVAIVGSESRRDRDHVAAGIRGRLRCAGVGLRASVRPWAWGSSSEADQRRTWRRAGVGDADLVGGVTEPDPVAVEEALPRCALAGDAGEPIGTADDEVARREAARRIGGDLGASPIRRLDRDRDVAARCLRRLRRDGGGDPDEASLDRLAEDARRKIQGRGQDGRPADDDPAARRPDLELPVRVGEARRERRSRGRARAAGRRTGCGRRCRPSRRRSRSEVGCRAGPTPR